MYPIGTPLAMLALLFRYRHAIATRTSRGGDDDLRGLAFLFRAYAKDKYWMPTIDMYRRLALSSMLVSSYDNSAIASQVSTPPSPAPTSHQLIFEPLQQLVAALMICLATTTAARELALCELWGLSIAAFASLIASSSPSQYPQFTMRTCRPSIMCVLLSSCCA